MSELSGRPRSIPDLLRACAAAADAPALIEPDGEPVSYGRLLGHVSRTGATLRALGIDRGDRVAVVLPNGADMAAAFLAVGSAAVCAPLNPGYRRAELEFYLADLRARALVTGPGVDPTARLLAEEWGLAVIELPPVGTSRPEHERDGHPEAPKARPEDVALVLHTSGTTARPKMVPLTHANLCASARNIAAALALESSDRCLNVMPLFHIHGLVGAVLASLWAGGSIVCTRGFHAPSFLASLETHEPTWYTAVPTMHQSVVARVRAEGRAVRHGLRFIRSSSAALPEPVLEDLERAFGVPVVESYGMTEAAHQMASNPLPPRERKPGSVGLAAGPRIAILGEGGVELSAGETGEVAIRGENVFAGYEANPEANERAFTGGWFRTGDEGCFDVDGYLFLRGRLKEIINRGGEKISPGEVEDALLAHPAVAEVVAFAVPDPSLGEDVGAAVVLEVAGSIGVRELQEFAAERVADFKVPRVVVLVDEIPKGATGKLQRIGLAERLGLDVSPEAPGSADFVAPRTEQERALAALVAEVLGVEVVGAEDDFFALGGDSLLAAELIARIRETYGRPHFPLSSLLWAPTVAGLAVELGADSTRRSLAVPIQAEGDRPPLFFVHGLDGEAVRYAGLSRRLSPGRPFYGIRARGVDGDEAPHHDLEEMVSAYVAEVRAVQPSGPYVLGGICMGGPVAIEIARQLQKQGDAVPLVVLIDPRVPSARNRQWLSWQLRLAGRRVRTGDYSWRLVRRERLHEVWDGLARHLPVARGDAASRAFERRMALIRDSYSPSVYSGRVAIVATIDYALREWFWSPFLVGSLEIVEIPHRHGPVLRPPAVDALAVELERMLSHLGPELSES